MNTNGARFVDGLLRGTLIAGVLVFGAACESRYDTRGNLPDPDLLLTIEPGQSSRDEVAQILGSPSSTAMFEDETWFYISQRVKTFAFFEPELQDRQVVIVKFDDTGVLQDVRMLGLEDSKTVLPAEGETPTRGNEPTLFEQFFGNLGRFNK